MESSVVDPSALTFREKKTLFSSICSSDCSSPQVGRLNNPFSASSSIRHQLEHHYPRYITASAPDRVRLAPAKLFGDATGSAGGSGSSNSGSAADFRRLSRQLSHMLILEASTQDTQERGRTGLSPAAAQPPAASSSPATATSSPPQSPDLVALLWLPEGAAGGAGAPARGCGAGGAGALAHTPAPSHAPVEKPIMKPVAARPIRCCPDDSATSSGGGAPMSCCGGGGSGCGATVTPAAAAPPPLPSGPPDPQLRAVAHLLSQFVAQSKERGVPVDPRVAQALRAAQSQSCCEGQEGPGPGLNLLGPGLSPLGSSTAGESGGGGGGNDGGSGGSSGDRGSSGGGEEQEEDSAGTPPPPPPPVPLLSPLDSLDSLPRLLPSTTGDREEGMDDGDGGKGAGRSESGGGAAAAVIVAAAAAEPSEAAAMICDVGVQADGLADAAEAPPSMEEPKAAGAPSPGVGVGAPRAEAACEAEAAGSSAEEACQALRRQARQLQKQLRQRALAQYDTNRASAVALRRSLHRLHEAAAAAAAVPAAAALAPEPAIAGYRDEDALAGGGGRCRRVSGPASAAADVDVNVAAQLRLEQRRRAELAAQCTRLQRQCDGLLSYIALLSGGGGTRLSAVAAAPSSAGLSPGCWLPLPSLPPEQPPHRAQPGAHEGRMVRVRLVLLPDEGAAAAAAAARQAAAAAVMAAEDAWEEHDGEAEGTDHAAGEDELADGAAARDIEPPVRVKLVLTVCRGGGGDRSVAIRRRAESGLPLWVTEAMAAVTSPYPLQPLLPGTPTEALHYGCEAVASAAVVDDAAVEGASGEQGPSVGQQQQQQQPQQEQRSGRQDHCGDQAAAAAVAAREAGGGGGLTAAVQQLVAAVEEQATAAAASGTQGGAAVVPPVPHSVLDGLRGVLQQLQGSDGSASGGGGVGVGANGSSIQSAEAAAAAARPLQLPHGKPPRPPAANSGGGGHRAAPAPAPGGDCDAHFPSGAPRNLQDELQALGASKADQLITASATALAAAEVEDGVGVGSDAAGANLARRSRSMPAIFAENEVPDDDDDDDADGGAGPSADGGAGAAAAATAATRPHCARRVPTPPCSPRTSAVCSPAASEDLGDADLDLTMDLDLELALGGSHVGSGSAAADGGGGSGSAASGGGYCDVDVEGYFGYDHGYGHGYDEMGYGEYGAELADLDYADLTEWDELAAAAAANGPGALLSAVGFLREQLQLAHLEIVSLTTQLGALSHQREGLRARATQHDAALQLLAIGEGEALQEVHKLRAQLASERAARARLSAQCEDLQNMLLSGLPDRPYNGGASQSHPFGSPSKSSHQHLHHHHHSGSLQRPAHAPHHPHNHGHSHGHSQPHGYSHSQTHLHQLQGSQAHQQLQQHLLLLMQQQQQQHPQQRAPLLQRHRSAPRHRPTGALSARGGESSGGDGLLGGLGLGLGPGLGGLPTVPAVQVGPSSGR